MKNDYNITKAYDLLKTNLGDIAKDIKIFPCDNCQKLRSFNEGGNIFTLCDRCWDLYYTKLNLK